MSGRRSSTGSRGVLLAGIIAQPTAFQGDAYLLPRSPPWSWAARRSWAVAASWSPTAVAAVFLSQLEQFVLALGVSFAVRTLVEAAALAVGVALYSVDWAAVRRRLTGSGRQPSAAAT